MNGVLGHDSAHEDYTGPGPTWANEVNFIMEHALNANEINIKIDWSTQG